MSETKERLKPFNADAACSKCGHDKVTATYYPDAEKDSDPMSRQYGVLRRQPTCEHLFRRCERCRYEWAESPI